MQDYREYPPNSEIRINDSFISGNGLTVHGDNNTLRVTDTTIHGNNNKVHGENATVRGNHNTIDGTNATVVGDHNVINGSNATMRGCFNTNNGPILRGCSDANGNVMQYLNGRPLNPAMWSWNRRNGQGPEPSTPATTLQHSQNANGDFVDAEGNLPTEHHPRVMLNRLNGQGPGPARNTAQERWDRLWRMHPPTRTVRTERYTMNANGVFVDSQGNPAPESQSFREFFRSNDTPFEGTVRTEMYTMNANGVLVDSQGNPAPQSQIFREMFSNDDTLGEEYYRNDNGQFVGLQTGGVLDPRVAAVLNAQFPHAQFPHGPQPSASSTPPASTTTPIRLHLRGVDEETEVREESCAICWVKKKVVMSTCCAALATCVQCARATYENKCVGSKQCMLCGQVVTEVFRVS